jgi:hypothetical protein
MKKSIILGILGLAAGVASTFGQGAVFLDNYQFSTYNPVTLSPALGGGLAPAGYTVQLWVDPTANANITGSVAADPTGVALPSALNAAFVAASGAGSTAAMATSAGGLAGYYEASASYLIQASGATQNSYTIMVVAFNGATYATSANRGHSAALYLADANVSTPFGGDIGLGFPVGTGPTIAGGAVPMITVFQAVPEPTTMALGGLGLAALLVARRKKA